MTNETPDSGTIDLTETVKLMKETFVKTSVDFIFQAASSTAYTFWLKWPVISTIFKTIVELVVSTLANMLEMEAFFINTAIRKASQAADYVNAVSELKALPETATFEEYENAEKKEMAAFRNFVRVTN
jgi:hypothetical protein